MREAIGTEDAGAGGKIGRNSVEYQRELRWLELLFQSKIMEFISCYGSEPYPIQSKNDQLAEEKLLSAAWRKLFSMINEQFQSYDVTFQHPQITFARHHAIEDIKIHRQDVVEFSLLEDSFYTGYSYWFQIKLDLKKCFVKLSCKVLKNGYPLKSAKQGLRQSLMKMGIFSVNSHFVEQNSLRVNPADGTFQLVHSNFLTRAEFDNFVRFPFQVCDDFKIKIRKMTQYFKVFLLGKILLFYNELSTSEIICFENMPVEYLAYPIIRGKPHPLFSDTQIQSLIKMEEKNNELERYVSLSHMEFSFFKMQLPEVDDNILKYMAQPPDIARLKENHSKKDEELYISRKGILPFHGDCLKVMKLYDDKAPINGVFFSRPFSPTTVKELRSFIGVRNAFNKKPCYQNIMLYKIEDEVKFARGGFTNISRFYGQYSPLEKPIGDSTCSTKEQAPPRRHVFVKKTEITENQASKSRIWWEKQILSFMGTVGCHFVNNFYLPELGPDLTAETIENSILMDYSPQKSLNIYLVNYGRFTSLDTKFYFMNHILMGLRYLRDLGIVHMDMKPENVLVRLTTFPNFPEENKYVLKLIDFGESYSRNHLNNKSKGSKGYTMPYICPQYLKGSEMMTQKADIFSVGVIMLCLFFEINTLEIKRAGTRVMVQNDYIRLYSMCYEKSLYYGQESLTKILLSVIFKCLDPDRKKRPHLDWLTVVMRGLANYTNRLGEVL